MKYRLPIFLWVLTSFCYGQFGGGSDLGMINSDSADVSIPTVSGGDPGSDDDWIILTSGEKLRGEILSMFDGELQFDSEILGDVSIDWDDIAEIKSDRMMSLRLDRRETISGKVQFQGEQVAVEETNGTVINVPKDDVVSMVQKEKSELDYWSFEVGVGVDFQRGNTNETAYSSNVGIKRETAMTRFKLNYLGNYTKTNGDTTTDNQMLNSSFDYFLDKQIFIRPIFVQYYRDPFQNIDFQGTIGSGIGYQLMKTSKLEWDIIAGPAYQLTTYQSVTAGSDRSVESPAAILATTVSYDITGDLTLDANYQYIFTNMKSGLLNANMNTTLTYEINDLLDFNTSLIWNYIYNPAQASDGSTPSKSDVSLIVGIGLSY